MGLTALDFLKVKSFLTWNTPAFHYLIDLFSQEHIITLHVGVKSKLYFYYECWPNLCIQSVNDIPMNSIQEFKMLSLFTCDWVKEQKWSTEWCLRRRYRLWDILSLAGNMLDWVYWAVNDEEKNHTGALDFCLLVVAF